MAYGVYSDRGYREHVLERSKNTNKTEVFTQEDQSFTGRKTFLSGVTTSDLEVQTVEVSDSLKVKGKDITEIIDYLPNDVSKENKLTTKAFVNSSISTNTANFLGTFNTLEEIEALTDVTNNDYAFWKTTDTLGNVVFKRYKYSADEQLWKFEYDLNNSSFTAVQWEAINSGITEELVSQIGQGGGSALVPSITQEQYNNLTEAEKNNGQIREITDTNPKKVMLNGMDLNEQLGNEPIGAVIPFGGSVIPRGYLLCNGQAVSRVDYAELFAIIGTVFGVGDGSATFNVPDLRETLPVGVGENTTLTIEDHDVYNLGEFKDDQLKDHTHSIYWNAKSVDGMSYARGDGSDPVSDLTSLVYSTNRTGITTHGKQLGFNYVIKAKHVAMPADFVDEVNKVNSYSTEETVIGKWIDEKPIYRKVFPINFNYTDSMRNVAKDIYNVSHVIHCYGVDYNNGYGCLYLRGWSKNGYLQAMSEYHSGSCTQVIFEYTKTTD